MSLSNFAFCTLLPRPSLLGRKCGNRPHRKPWPPVADVYFILRQLQQAKDQFWFLLQKQSEAETFKETTLCGDFFRLALALKALGSWLGQTGVQTDSLSVQQHSHHWYTPSKIGPAKEIMGFDGFESEGYDMSISCPCEPRSSEAFTGLQTDQFHQAPFWRHHVVKRLLVRL